MSNSSCSDRTQALRLAGGQVLEPVMSLEVTVGEEYLGTVLGDLAQRRGTVRDIQSRHDDKTLLANVPLAEMMVSSTIRSIFTLNQLHPKLYYSQKHYCFVLYQMCILLKGYSTILRTLTSGNATFSLELDTYEAMNPQDQNTLLKRVAGLL